MHAAPCTDSDQRREVQLTPDRARAAGRPVRMLSAGAPPADPAAAPAPAGAFDAPDALLPGVLMAWDFCHSYRRAAGLPCLLRVC